MNPARTFQSLRIRNKLLLSFLAVFIPLAAGGSVVIYSLVEETLQSNIESQLKNTTASMLNLVRHSATVSIKNRLRAIAEKNREIAQRIYQRHLEGEITRKEAMQQIRDILLSQTIGKTGYIYCIDSNGTAVVHPRKRVEGYNFAQFDFIKEQIRRKEGYIEYDWKNPGEKEARPKALYMTYFEPLDWILSVSTYREEFNALIDLEDFRNSILSFRFGPSGYAYVLDHEGTAVIHPKLEGINPLRDGGTQDASFIETMLAQKNGKIVYSWQNPGESATRRKLVFFNYIPEYRWIVASSSYMDEIFAPLHQVRNIILLALLGALAVAAAVTFWISATITRPLQRLMDRLAAGARGDFSVRLAHPPKDELGQLTRYFNTFMERLEAYSNELTSEVQDRRQAEAALRESETRFRQLYEKSREAEEVYRSLLNSSADAIVIYDMHGHVRYISPAFTQIFGWTFAELEGRKIDFVPESEIDASMAIISGLIEQGTPCHGFETRRRTKDGRLLDVSISGSRYNDHNGRPGGMLAILRDISDRKQLEAQIHHSQRMEAIGTLAGGIAHDFNNILMGIQGRASLLLLDTDAAHPAVEHLTEIESYVNRAADLTRQLLGFARGGKYTLKAADPNQIVESSADMFGRTKKEISIQSDFQDGVWAVEVDRSQIEQVLLNIFVNAWQAMPAGGPLYLKTRNVVLDEAVVRPYDVAPGRFVQITVRDTGCGMDAAVKQRVFDPFFTTKEMGRGTGLGLASAYGIIRNHGGMITVDSIRGQGATFVIYLPASDKAVVEEQPAVRGPMPGSGVILLVDDEEMILEVSRRLIERLGYTVMIAGSGEEAIDVFTHFRDRIDAVILDMVMPEMSGGDTFNRLKQIDPAVKVLLSSGYSIEGQARQIIERGCLGFIQKPFSLEEISARLSEITGGVSKTPPLPT